jgi:hypothetical protein
MSWNGKHACDARPQVISTDACSEKNRLKFVPFSSQPDREMQATLTSSWRWREACALLSLSSVPALLLPAIYASNKEREIGINRGRLLLNSEVAARLMRFFFFETNRRGF